MRGQLDISGNNIINIGSLGIGTATPAFALDISGGQGRIINTSASVSGLTVNSGATNTVGMNLTSSGTGWGSGLSLQNTATTTGRNFGIYSGADSKLHIVDITNSNDRIVVESGGGVVISGNVGIGITPTTVLDVNGAAKIRGTLDLTSQKITNVASPTTTTDVATKSYVDVAMPIGGIIMWSGSTLPTNWGLCDGSTYGGVVSPDLRGRFVLSSGQGSGLTNRTLGQTGGAETHTLSVSEMPAHRHSCNTYHYDNYTMTHNAISTPAFCGTNSQDGNHYTRNSGAIHIADAGSGSAHNNMTPYYVLAFIIRYQ
jgi:microcystin-dependent protein